MAQAIPYVVASAQVGSGFFSAGSIRRQGGMEALQNRFNAEMAGITAEDVLRRGEKEAGRVRRAGKAVRGDQRAAYAAQGIEVDSGSAADIQEETGILNEEDVRTVRNNAWREAFGYKTQAADYRLAASYAKYKSREEARRTILTGALQGTTTLLASAGRSSGSSKSSKTKG